MKIETGERRSLWHKYINIAVLNYNTSYHTSIGCEPSRVLHGRIPYNVLDLKMGIRPQQQPIPNLQIAQEFLEQTEMIHQDVRKNRMQAYINTRPIMTRKPTLQNLKKQITYKFCSPKRIIKATKFHSQNFVGLARILSKKYCQTILFVTQNWHQQDASASSDENASVHTRQPPADITVKPQEYKSDPEVSLNHDDLYARAWECDYEQPIFDAENDNEAPTNSHEIPVQSDLSTEEMRNTPGEPYVYSPEFFPCTDDVSDVIDTCPHMQPDVGDKLGTTAK